jgi:glycosyltransferase involved in cell wall biosynthesis
MHPGMKNQGGATLKPKRRSLKNWEGSVSELLISIISANVDSPEWAELLVKSVRKYATLPNEIIIIDNGSVGEGNMPALTDMAKRGWIKLVRNGHNAGHGGAMDQATRIAAGKYVCFTDIDSHFQREGWDVDLVALYESDPMIRMIGVIGPEHKPYHPPLFFYEPKFILENHLTFRYMPGVEGSTDTAQKVYWDIIALGYRSERLEKGPKLYPGTIGDEIMLAGKGTIYHMWNGTRFLENRKGGAKAFLDGIPLSAHLAEKAKLFAVPQVREILTTI